MSEGEVDALGPDGQAAPARVDRDRRAPRFSWTPAYETTFFRSRCESVQLGLREHNSFKAEAWERAAQALQATHGAFPAKSHLINKSDNARKRFRLWRGLREDPEFIYNEDARTVTATEEAWGAHIKREPLSRALRGRPFEHEAFMEMLYPDVVGSRGAPKRIMKPRRRTDGASIDDPDMPGTAVINLQTDTAPMLSNNSPGLQPRPLLSQTSTASSTGSLPTQRLPTLHSQNAQPQPPPPTANASALTPPDETVPHPQQAQGRKRRQQTNISQAVAAEISPPLPTADLTPRPELQAASSSPQKRRRTSSRGGATTPNTTIPFPSTTATAVPNAAAAGAVAAAAATPAQKQDTLSMLHVPLLEEMVEALKHRAAPRWREQALEIFFRDFAGEELDLQVKISENVLSNEHKAMVFCKMPLRVRQHWVGKFREMHQLNKTT